jgi:hypothetical protein
MISKEEFLHRCEMAKRTSRLRADRAQEAERELKALCALTGYNVDGQTPYGGSRSLTVTDLTGALVMGGPAYEVLAALACESAEILELV